MQPVESPGSYQRGDAGDVDVTHAEHVQVGGGAHLLEHGIHLSGSELGIVKVCLNTSIYLTLTTSYCYTVTLSH